MAHDPKDDVDMLFACFKCGVSPPPSALKDMKSNTGKPARSLNGGSLAVDVKEDPSCSKRVEKSSPHSRVRSCCPSATAAIKFRSGKMISPVVFYGSPLGVPVKRSSRILKLLQEIRIDLGDESSLVLRNAIWSTFPRQEDAVRFARTHPKSNVFSYQDHLTGQRRFLVSTYDEFWRRYIRMDSKLRHHYEVIQEGLPCHLYFDLEFNKKFNIDRNVDEMVDILISVTLNAVSEKYSIGGNLEWIVELDSSTEEKFSRHVIVRLPKTAFKDNSHVGAFVSEICSRIAYLRERDPHVNKLYIMKDSCCSDLANQLFLDTAVYSRNRCFRLAFSSKAGKSSFLVPTGRFKCKNMNEHQVFLESLICRMDEDCEKILICKMDLGCTKTLCFDSEVHAQNQNFPHEVASHAPRSDITSTYVIGRSPFPALDAFVESIASCGSTSGKIQSWYWFSAYGLIVYNMSRNRYCERIGREHKSNHVMYVVDFQRAGYYQKCHDPDCKGYRSPFRPLPWDAFPDSSTLSSSTQIESYKEVINVVIDLHVGKNNLDVSSLEDEQLLADCCSNMSWWREATMLAECIENTRNVPDVRKSDVDIIYDDCSWWKDVEKMVSQVE